MQGVLTRGGFIGRRKNVEGGSDSSFRYNNQFDIFMLNENHFIIMKYNHDTHSKQQTFLTGLANNWIILQMKPRPIKKNRESNRVKEGQAPS